MAEALVQSLILAGLPKAKAEQAAKNAKVGPTLAKIVNNANIVDASKNPKQGNLLLHLATAAQDIPDNDQVLLAERIVDARLQSVDQVNGKVQVSYA